MFFRSVKNLCIVQCISPLQSGATTSGGTSSFALLALAVSLLFFASCKDDNGVDPDGKFRIGIMLPLTGAASSVGESASAAIDIAIDDVKDYLDATGNDLEIEVTIKDTETDPGVSLQKIMELNDADVDYIIGPYASANAESVLSYANENEMLLFCPASVASTLAISGDNLYRLLPSDKNQAEAIAALLAHDSILYVIPVVRNDVWGDGLLNDAGAILSAEGINMVDAIFYDPSNLNSTIIAGQVSSAISQLQGQVAASKIAVYLLSYGEGTDILNASSLESNNSLVRWYGSSAFANSNNLLLNDVAGAFALAQNFRAPSFAPDPSGYDRWGPVNDKLTLTLGRTPEIFALTTYDAVWMMVLAHVLAQDPADLAEFKSSLEHLTGYYNGITGRTTLDENGDRKYASFNFWGIEQSAGEYAWKSYGYYRNSDGQLVLF